MLTRLLCTLCLILPNLAMAGSLNLAVAANFKQPLERLVRQFDPEQQHQIAISSASTGVLYTQIRQGAPFDILLAADSARPERLEQEGPGIAGSRFTYAIGQLALWQPKGHPDSLKDLLDAPLAIANPRTAPYGLAAQQVLKALDRWQPAQQVQGSNIAQTFQFIHSGNVPQGLVARAQLIQQSIPPAQWVLVDPELHQPIEQQLIQLQRSAGNPLADAFIEFLHSAEARQLIEQNGYVPGKGITHAAH
ncbi:molybdate ABC transporter substrate-binding protein [Marinobacterium maritimum]|uniref:Molybdate ABC transporter substrate-binding protein n=1 Tax=Marinobacterium maritimum TaxID=500162 RepID=A0ABN1IAY1_9GAMM